MRQLEEGLPGALGPRLRRLEGPAESVVFAPKTADGELKSWDLMLWRPKPDFDLAGSGVCIDRPLRDDVELEARRPMSSPSGQTYEGERSCKQGCHQICERVTDMSHIANHQLAARRA